MTIAENMTSIMAASAWIGKMFEEGARLKSVYGAGKVYDFSLGNPNVPPPPEFKKALHKTVDAVDDAGHGYMPTAGYPAVRAAVAAYLASQYGVPLTANEVVMTCGAAGALNVILRAILDPGDEVVVPTPYFSEYRYYAANHGGKLRPVPTRPDFSLDVGAIAKALTKKSKAVLINIPNNPTGQIYSGDSLEALAAVLSEKGKLFERTLYLISDEPYRKIVYDGARVPSIFGCYRESILANSYSKDISIPGERIGFAAVHPEATYKKDLVGGITLANRILGFVNAPALMQRVVAGIQGSSVDIGAYARKRKLLCDGLADCGYEFTQPRGAFYLFPKSPLKDDVQFVNALQKELILALPGSGFGAPGYFRLAFCVADETIVNALPGFKKVMESS